ncbi:hypothetical protein G5C51_39685 [Streptomyces sp. A7024]|uniref:HEAT repeat domain-containing protein n=1 Tax=Streptomyces coryli TaxID=1128680 RepID=A0A6G4UEM3_9ACTN|nr:hypothetical protein [Streptomyces coryli]
MPAGAEGAQFERVYVAAGRTEAVRCLCIGCRERHLSFAAEAEARFRHEHPVDVVCARLEDSDRGVRAEAARQLVRLDDRRAVSALCDALAREASPGAAFEDIVEALGVFGGPEAERALIGVLDDKKAWARPDRGEDYGRSRVDIVAEALVAMGGSGLFVRAVLRTLTSSDIGSGLRERAAHELADMAYRSTVGYGLLPWVDEKLTGADRELMVEPLRSVLGDPNWQVRQQATTALGHLGDALGNLGGPRAR